MRKFYYSETCSRFLRADDNAILGEMGSQNEFDLTLEQRDAWQQEIPIMKQVVRELGGDGQIVFEYTIPRLGKRVDVVLLIRGIVFAIEFKTGEDDFSANDKEQVWDYALDLKNFHEESRNRIIVPILVATEAPDKACSTGPGIFSVYDDHVYFPMFANSARLLSLRSSRFSQKKDRKRPSMPTSGSSAATTPRPRLSRRHPPST